MSLLEIDNRRAIIDRRAIAERFEGLGSTKKAQAEAAAILETTPKAIESRLYRARKILRERLQKWL